MKRLRIRDRDNAPLARDPAAHHSDVPDLLDEVWNLGALDAAAGDMSGDVIRQALGIDPVAAVAQPVGDLAPPTSDESLTWLEAVPSATSTSELAAFISEGEPAKRPARRGARAWVVSVEELAEATGTTPSSGRSTPAAPDLEIDWDVVATVPRATAHRSTRQWERRIRSENERRAADPDMSDTDLARLREVLDEGPTPPQRRSA